MRSGYTHTVLLCFLASAHAYTQSGHAITGLASPPALRMRTSSPAAARRRADASRVAMGGLAALAARQAVIAAPLAPTRGMLGVVPSLWRLLLVASASLVITLTLMPALIALRQALPALRPTARAAVGAPAAPRSVGGGIGAVLLLPLRAVGVALSLVLGLVARACGLAA
eukprot:427623-Prymnesium_polylepis.1